MIDAYNQITHCLAHGQELISQYYFPPEAKQITLSITTYHQNKADFEKQQNRFYKAIFSFEEAEYWVNIFLEKDENSKNIDYIYYIKATILQEMATLITRAITVGHLKNNQALQHIYGEKTLNMLDSIEEITYPLYVRYCDVEKNIFSAKLAILLYAVQVNSIKIYDTIQNYLINVKNIDFKILNQDIEGRMQKKAEYKKIMSNPLSIEFDITLDQVLFNLSSTEIHSKLSNLNLTV